MVDVIALRKDHAEALAKYEEIIKKIQGLDQQKSELTTQAVELQGQLKYLAVTIRKEEENENNSLKSKTVNAEVVPNV